ncbi:MAG: transporter associated domain-containing protein [Finegoldia sp.]|nr:transporter associated domain-containing protein [Finegoldia sp.]
MYKKLIKKINIFVRLLEMIIGIIILLAVIGGIPDLLRYIKNIFLTGDLSLSFNIFNEFLKHALLLIVGIELLEMIITKSHEAILTLILFVIARKMLVHSVGMVDILIGSISIAIIFLVIKFLSNDDKLIAQLDNTFSASMPLEKIKREYNLDVPIEMANTIGGLAYELAKLEDFEEIKENSFFAYGKYIYKIVEVEDGVIQRVRILKNDPNDH